MYPLNTIAFTQANSFRWKLAKKYRNAFILSPDGVFRKIDNIKVVGLFGSSTLSKLWSLLTNYWKIKVSLSEPLLYSLDEIKQLIVKCADSWQSMDNMELHDEKSKKEFLSSIQNAQSIEIVINSLRLPSPENSLDLL